MKRAPLAGFELIKHNSRQLRKRKYLQLTIVVVMVGLIGTILLLNTHAATHTASIEPEAAPTISSAASKKTDSTASSDVGVEFARNLGRAMYEPADGTAYIGLATSSTNNYVTNFDKAVGITTHPAIFNSFITGNGDLQSRLNTMTNAGKNGIDPALVGSTLMLSWAVTFSNGVVTDGSTDDYINQMANEVKTYNKPVFIRLNWEMNSYSFTAFNQSGGTTPASYVASWQRIRSIFKTTAPKAAFVWCPAKGEYNDPSGTPTPTDAWYPGDQYVDWTCIDGYPEYYTPTSYVVTTPYGFNWAADFSNAHKKPLMLGEYGRGSTPTSTNPVPDSSAAFDVVFGWANANPVVKALCYFDLGDTHQLEAEPPTDPTSGATNPSPFPLGLQAYRNYTVGKSRFLYTLVQ